jgi:transcriptional antiterminator
MKENFSFAKIFGTHRSILEEPLSWVEEYPIQWREPRFDLAELAKLRWIEGLSRKQLAKKYGRSEVAVQNYFQTIRRKNFRVRGLSEAERRKILNYIAAQKRNGE